MSLQHDTVAKQMAAIAIKNNNAVLFIAVKQMVNNLILFYRCRITENTAWKNELFFVYVAKIGFSSRYKLGIGLSSMLGL